MTQLKIEQHPNIETHTQGKRTEATPKEIKKEEGNLSQQKSNSISDASKVRKDLSISTKPDKLTEISDIIEKVHSREEKDRTRLDKKDLEEIKKATNQVLEQINIELDFSVDKDLNTVVVKVINKETGKVIRQIPPEEMLKIAKRIEEMSGILLDRWS